MKKQDDYKELFNLNLIVKDNSSLNKLLNILIKIVSFPILHTYTITHTYKLIHNIDNFINNVNINEQQTQQN